uniref:Major facilitator superfamily (MFS) profile domain-containing protein n=1 Tax=Glossina palpalis gambiensis TaxID=67801 RepID=A0A1B0C0E9_9MUSC
MYLEFSSNDNNDLIAAAPRKKVHHNIISPYIQLSVNIGNKIGNSKICEWLLLIKRNQPSLNNNTNNNNKFLFCEEKAVTSKTKHYYKRIFFKRIEMIRTSTKLKGDKVENYLRLSVTFISLGGSGPVIWSYFAEFQPKAKRGCMLSFMAAFWTFGNLFVAGLAWLIIPTNIGFVTSIFTYNSWRIFLMVCSTPSFLVAFLLFYLPESPKFLLSKGKPDRAMAIFRGIFVTNNKKSPDLYPVAELDFDEKLMQELKEKRESLKGKYTKMLSNMAEHSKELFRRPILKFTIVSITINFTFHIGYYGLMMWFPELFSRFEEYSNTFPNQTAGVCIVTEYIVGKGNQDNAICSAHIPSAVFMESLISLASALPANLIAILGMDLLGRKFFLIFGTMTAGVCSAAMYFVYNSTQNLIATAVFSGAISTANAALDCLITEVFPTHLRATGVAVSMVAARMGGIIGNIVIATLLDQYCPAPTIIVAVLLIGGGLMSLFLPNTTRKELN